MNRLISCLLVITLALACNTNALAGSTNTLGPTPLQYFGLHIHRAVQPQPWLPNGDKITAWPSVKFGSWRLWDAYVAWPNLEPEKGKWNFAILDKYVAMAKLTNVDLLLPLGLSPTWASARPSEPSSYRPGNAAEPRDIEDWRNYVRTVATRYRGSIHNFEIWNEPNEKGFFSGTQEKLIELTCVAQQELKLVSPENQLVSPSMVGEADQPEMLEAFLKKGGKNCVDIIGYHFYVPKKAPEAIVALVGRVRGAMTRAGVGNMPLWNTETGWWIENSDGSPEIYGASWAKRISADQSGAWVSRALIVGRAAGLERFYWYAWDNNTFGLIEPSSSSYKPGAQAYAAVVRWLTGAAGVECSTNLTLWTCRVLGSVNGVHLIVWDTARQTVFPVPAGKRVSDIDHLDGTSDAVGTLASLRAIPISGWPIRVTLLNIK